MTKVYELYESVQGVNMGSPSTERRIGFYSSKDKAKKAKSEIKHWGAYYIREHEVN